MISIFIYPQWNYAKGIKIRKRVSTLKERIMHSKPIVIVAAFLFSVSSQAGSHDIHRTLMGDNTSTNNLAHIRILPQQQPSSGATNVYARNSQTLVPSSLGSVNHVTDIVNSHDAFEHESVIFLAQGMDGFITF